MRSWSIVRTVIIGCALLAVGSYAIFEARGIITGPSITLTTPRSGETLTEPTYQLAGRADRVAKITLNGRPISISEDGTISEALVLLPGYNKTTIEAWDRFGTRTEIILENYFIRT